MIIAEQTFAVLWSPHQNMISVETVEEMIKTNLSIFAAQTNGDFIVLGFAETLEKAREAASFFQKVRNDRQSGQLPADEVKTNQEALEIARSFARQNNCNETKAEAFAETWFDAGKDYDKSSPDELRAYLVRRFQN